MAYGLSGTVQQQLFPTIPTTKKSPDSPDSLDSTSRGVRDRNSLPLFFWNFNRCTSILLLQFHKNLIDNVVKAVPRAWRAHCFDTGNSPGDPRLGSR